jgi:hypothetical protein
MRSEQQLPGTYSPANRDPRGLLAHLGERGLQDRAAPGDRHYPIIHLTPRRPPLPNLVTYSAPRPA